MFGINALIRTFDAIFRNRLAAFRICGFWFPFYVLVSNPWLLWEVTEGTAPYISRPMPQIVEDYYGWFFALGFVLLIVSFVGIAIVAVGWHRFVLRGETPKSVLIWPKGWPIKRYFWTVVLLVLLGIPLFFLLHFRDFTSPEIALAADDGFSSYWGTVKTFLVWLLPSIFLGLVLPAIALGVKSTFSFSLSLTKQHFFSLLLLVIVLALIFPLPSVLIGEFIGPVTHIGEGATGWLAFFLSMISSWVIILLEIGVLSEIYRSYRLPLAIGDQRSSLHLET